MKLRQMLCLCAVVEADFNITRAADTLYATQPAVGKQLRQFEEEIGAELLVRRGARLVGLTDAGQQALVWARAALQCVNNIKAIGEEAGNESRGSIVLATTHTHARYVLLPAIKAFTRKYPDVKLNVLQGTPEGVAEMLENGKAGVGVTSLPANLSSQLVALPVLTATHIMVAPTGHPILRMRGLTLEKLARFPIIMQNPSRLQGARIERKFRDAGLEVHVAVQALDTDVMKTYVVAGLGIAIIPSFTFNANLDPGLRMRDVGHLFDPTTSVVLLRKGGHLKRYVYDFLSDLAPTLERQHIDPLLFNEPDTP